MKSQEIQKILDHFFPKSKPFLNYTSLYTLLIAVLLSAQTTDKRVNQVTKKLFSIADTPNQMRTLDPEELEKIIRSCGLGKTKANAIINLSKICEKKFHGEIPKTLKCLETLPGVGHKTASVVMAQGYGKPAFPVDTHIYRCARRWGLSKGKSVVAVEKDLKKKFPKKDWIKLHLQIISFARKFCPARGHVSSQCPICSQLGITPQGT